MLAQAPLGRNLLAPLPTGRSTEEAPTPRAPKEGTAPTRQSAALEPKWPLFALLCSGAKLLLSLSLSFFLIHPSLSFARAEGKGAPLSLSHSRFLLPHSQARAVPHPPGSPHAISDSCVVTDIASLSGRRPPPAPCVKRPARAPHTKRLRFHRLQTARHLSRLPGRNWP